ncbi:uncharacterized protein LOC111040429 [Myzus persicae]|uniref:uncharacterized protein LOC111040429 n=1 Tax=Myzus persicae TaxID=13164 RepID=UPI000B937BA6|nr:uncharacterized protein LOC111040429 [Myzus persicae]
MFTIYFCLVSVILAPLVSSKISLISLGGKTYLNGQFEVKAPDNGSIKDGIVNGHTKGLKLIIEKILTLQERLALLERLKKSNDKSTQMEKERMKILEDREDELERLVKGEEEQRLNNLINENKVPQEAISRKKFIVKEIPEQKKK